MQLQHSRITQFSGQHAKMLLPMQPSMRQVARSAQIAVVATATRREMLEKRHHRVRSKVEGTPERPRLAVFRSSNHIYAQVIDDSEGNTLAAVSTLTPEIRKQLSANNGSNTDAAKLVGAKIAELCKQANIELVCFDRGGFRYHGRVRALADAAREGGLNF